MRNQARLDCEQPTVIEEAMRNQARLDCEQPTVIGEVQSGGIHGGGDFRRWRIFLNRYQRDNLFLFFAALGYVGDVDGTRHGAARGCAGIDPINLLNNGDWVGEVAYMLRDPLQKNVISSSGLQLSSCDRPHTTLRALREGVDAWRPNPVRPVVELLAPYISPENWAIVLAKADPELRKTLVNAKTDKDSDSQK